MDGVVRAMGACDRCAPTLAVLCRKLRRDRDRPTAVGKFKKSLCPACRPIADTLQQARTQQSVRKLRVAVLCGRFALRLVARRGAAWSRVMGNTIGVARVTCIERWLLARPEHPLRCASCLRVEGTLAAPCRRQVALGAFGATYAAKIWGWVVEHEREHPVVPRALSKDAQWLLSPATVTMWSAFDSGLSPCTGRAVRGDSVREVMPIRKVARLVKLFCDRVVRLRNKFAYRLFFRVLARDRRAAFDIRARQHQQAIASGAALPARAGKYAPSASLVADDSGVRTAAITWCARCDAVMSALMLPGTKRRWLRDYAALRATSALFFCNATTPAALTSCRHGAYAALKLRVIPRMWARVAVVACVVGATIGRIKRRRHVARSEQRAAKLRELGVKLPLGDTNPQLYAGWAPFCLVAAACVSPPRCAAMLTWLETRYTSAVGPLTADATASAVVAKIDGEVCGHCMLAAESELAARRRKDEAARVKVTGKPAPKPAGRSPSVSPSNSTGSTPKNSSRRQTRTEAYWRRRA